MGTRKMSKASATHERTAPRAPEVGIAARAEGSEKGKGGVGPSGDDPFEKSSAHPKWMWDLCRIWPHTEGELFQALSMVALPEGEPEAPYALQWPTLKADNRIWSDESTTQEFSRGTLHPMLAK